MEVADTENVVRDFKITKSLIEKFGVSENCPGCDGHLMGNRRRHTDQCRKRFEKAMMEDDLLGERVKARDTRKRKEDEPDEGLKTRDARKRKEDEPDVNMGGVEPPVLGYEALPAEFMEHDADLDEMPDLQPEDDEDIGLPSTRRRQADDSESRTSQSKRRRVDEAIKQLTALIESSKLKAGEMSRKRICNVSRWVSQVIGEVAEKMPTPHEEVEDHWIEMYRGMEFLDDVNGYMPLDKSSVIEARKTEIAYFKKMGIYRKLSRDEAKLGKHKIISTKWIDTNKGDTANPNYRSRLVGREIKRDKRLDLFAATPPLETIKYLVARCAQEQSRSKSWRIATIDVRRAYFYAPSRRQLYVEIPAEDREPGDEGRVGRLELSLYGTRDAALNWAAEYTMYLKSLGFQQGIASPCNFMHKEMELNITVHGDDFLIVGPLMSIKWLNVKMRAKYDIKSQVVGPEEECDKELKILGRIIRWTSKGLEYEPDQRHAEILVRDLGMCGSRPVATPGTKDEREAESKHKEDDEYDGDDPMTSESATKYRGLAARLNFLAMDRSDLQYAAKECCKKMASPIMSDWSRLKRVARYLKAHARMVQVFKFEKSSRTLEGFGDSDWAGDKIKAKSTS